VTTIVSPKIGGGAFLPLVMIFAGTNMTESLVKRAPPWRILIGALSRAEWRPVYGSRISYRKLYHPKVFQMLLSLRALIAVQEHTSDRTG
jgi:hypothetical protein